MAIRSAFAVGVVSVIGFAAGRASSSRRIDPPQPPPVCREIRDVRELVKQAPPAVARAALVGKIFADDTEVEPPEPEAAAEIPSPPPPPRVETGVIDGVIRDAASGEPLVGVTVMATAPDVQAMTVLTDSDGKYRMDVVRATYLVTLYYADLTLERPGVSVNVDQTTTVSLALSTDRSDNEYRNIPVRGRTFDEVLGVTTGEQGDPNGEPGEPTGGSM